MISQKKDWYFYDQFSMIFFLQKFKEDTNVHLAIKVQERKRTSELLLNYIHMFQLKLLRSTFS